MKTNAKTHRAAWGQRAFPRKLRSAGCKAKRTQTRKWNAQCFALSPSSIANAINDFFHCGCSELLARARHAADFEWGQF